MFNWIAKKLFANGVNSEDLIDQLYNDTRSYVRKVTLSANGTYAVPAGYRIDSITLRNTTANAVTGGIRIGTAAAGAQVVVAQAVGASALLEIANASILLRVFSMTAVQLLYIEAVTAWNTATVEVYVRLTKLA